jgi:uncharacterized protein YueI
MKDKMEDYLERGLYGVQETKASERARYLTALRERIELALKKGQVMKEQTYPEVIQQLKRVQNGHLYLNGEIAYRFLSKYVKAANDTKVPFTIVQNQEAETDIGLVLTGSMGSEEKEIFIAD